MKIPVKYHIRGSNMNLMNSPTKDCRKEFDVEAVTFADAMYKAVSRFQKTGFEPTEILIRRVQRES